MRPLKEWDLPVVPEEEKKLVLTTLEEIDPIYRIPVYMEDVKDPFVAFMSTPTKTTEINFATVDPLLPTIEVTTKQFVAAVLDCDEDDVINVKVERLAANEMDKNCCMITGSLQINAILSDEVPANLIINACMIDGIIYYDRVIINGSVELKLNKTADDKIDPFIDNITDEDLVQEEDVLSESEEEKKEETEDDIFIQSAGSLGARTEIFQNNKLIIERRDGTWWCDTTQQEYFDLDEALKAHMKAENYWPNIWSVSDHGNLIPWSFKEEEY